MNAEFNAEVNAGGVFSVSRVRYQYTGGAHGQTEIYNETFCASTGKLLQLDDFFTVGRDVYIERLLEFVDYTINKSPDEFWPDAKQTARDVFPYDTFVITKNGISLIFPEYNIAPFSTGTVRVDIPWGAVAEWFILPGQ